MNSREMLLDRAEVLRVLAERPEWQSRLIEQYREAWRRKQGLNVVDLATWKARRVARPEDK